MIFRNKRDIESWVREKNVETMKENPYVRENDIIEVISGNFYKVIKTPTDIPLKNNLYAELIPSEVIGNISTATKLKTARNIALSGDVTGNANFDGSANITITATVVNDSHNHSNDTITSLDASKVNTGILSADRVPNLNADKINSGILAVARIPDLDSSKIATGILDVKRIPDLDTSKITTGILNVSRIPNLDASKITTGTLNPDRLSVLPTSKIPNLDTSKITSGTLSSDRLPVLPTGKIPNLDASKITSGTISIDRLPQGALERCVVVADDASRFKLTSAQVQLGDTVKVTATNKMYFVMNTSKLNSEDGYTVYTAGTATEVPWSGVTGRPSKFPPETHTHTKSQITDFPSALKNPTSLTIQLNGASQGGYDGSSAKTINVTANNVGAYTKSETESKLNGKANISHGNHVPATQSANNKVYLRNDNTWHTLIPSDIGAQPAGNYSVNGHIHDERYYTETEVNNLLSGKANTSHGTHVPSPQSANNKVFLRSDNTWATVTPENIGAQPVGNYASAFHEHNTSDITSLKGYSKAQSGSALTVTDSLNVALGKLEALSTEGFKIVGFKIEGNDLIMEYAGDTKPDFVIKDGFLYYNF